MASPGATVVNKVRTDFETSGLARSQSQLKGITAELRKQTRMAKAMHRVNRMAAAAEKAEQSRLGKLRARAARIGRIRAKAARAERDRLKETARLRGVMMGHRRTAIKQMRTMGRIAKAGLIGGAGVVAGLMAVGKAAQDSELRISGLLQKNSQLFGGEFKGFKQAHSAAKGLRMEFREMARTSPVGSRAIESSFVSMTTELSRGGIGLKQQKELAKQAAVADLGNATKGTAARDVSQLLRGRAGKDITTPALVGQTAKDIAALAKSGKIKEAAAAISKVLKPSKELEQAYASSFTGATSSLKDSLLEAGETAAAPLMKTLADGAKDLLKWMTANRQRVKQIARSIGTGIVKGLKIAGKIVKSIADNWQLVAGALKIAATVYLVRMASTMIGLVASSAAYARNMAAGSAAGARGGKAGEGKAAGAGIGGAALILAGVYEAATGIAGSVDKSQQKGINRTAAIREQIAFTQTDKAHRAKTKARNEAIWKKAGIKGFGKQRPDVETGKFAGAPPTDPRDKRGGGGGGGTMKVRKFIADNVELSERGTTRLMSPVIRDLARVIRSNNPMSTQVGLGGLRVANGVR